MRIIFHGDDFGLTSGINQGVFDAFRRGLLTSSSIVTAGEAAEEALNLAKKCAGLDLGIHLVLCDERPLLPPHRIPSVLMPDHRFPTREQLLLRVLMGKINLMEVYGEWKAQIERLLNEGIRPSHLDGHQYVHLFPGLLPVTLKLAKEYGIPFVRGVIVDRLEPGSGIKRLTQWAALKSWTVLNSFRLESLEGGSIPSVGFLKAGGRMTREYALKTLDQLGSKGIWPVIEINFHPGSGDAHTLRKYRHWRYDWKSDLDLLMDESLRKSLLERGAVFSSFRKEKGGPGMAHPDGPSGAGP